jgi:hypothetical protein
MYMKVVLTLLALALIAIVIELAALTRLAARQKSAVVNQIPGLNGTSVALDAPRTPDDLVLDRIVERIEIPEMPLAKALREFEAQTKVPVYIAPGREDDIRVNGPVEAHLQHVPVFDALEMILSQVPPPPEFGVRGNRVVIGEPGDMEVRLYDVRSIADGSYPAQPSHTGWSPVPAGDRSVEALANLLQTWVAEESWTPVDGRGGGEIRRWGGFLVIKQTAAHHREIARVLANLKAASGLPGNPNESHVH